MAKIGTAHIEIKPVVSDELLAGVGERITQVVREAVERGLREGFAASGEDELVRIANFINSDGTIEALQTAFGLTRRTAYRRVSDAREAGLISK